MADVRRFRPLVVCALPALLVASACEERAAPRSDAGSALPAGARADAGADAGVACRPGPIDALEQDDRCTVARPDLDEVARALRTLQLSATANPPEVRPSGLVDVRVRITNTGPRPVPVYLESVIGAAEPDWSAIAGLPPRRPAEGFRVPFSLRTFDDRQVPVDRWREAAARDLQTRVVRVELPPGAALTKALPWVPIAIPAPPPPYTDDAGHRIQVKSVPHPLNPGAYTIRIDVPLYGATPEQRQVATSVRLTPAE